jgi:Predicted metal-binding, possibly nucleic acid-binding protein
MKSKRDYEIAFVGLKPGLHVFNYQIHDNFFEHVEQKDFESANVDVKLTFDKKNGLFLLHFDINGSVKIACDRCGDFFELQLWDEFDLVVKQVDDELVESKNETDAEVAYIARSQSTLDVSGWIYEFIILSIPMQRLHPDDENGNSTCNPDTIKYLNQQNQSSSNALWSQLKDKLKQ